LIAVLGSFGSIFVDRRIERQSPPRAAIDRQAFARVISHSAFLVRVVVVVVVV
jgi:hypothetical protein